MNNKVSIIIPVYNGENYIREAIDSALSQTYKNIEIIVVNDGSKDNTDEICKSYGKKIKYIKKENGGVATALNTGIKAAKGQYIAWLSHDDLYKENRIEKGMEALKELKDKDTIIFSNFELIDFNGKVFSRTDFLSDISREKLCQGFYPVVCAAVNGCTTLINKNCFKKVGLFDESLRTSQDYDMWLKLLKIYPSYCLNESLVQYRVHPGQDTVKNPLTIKESNEIWKRIINDLNADIISSWNLNPTQVYFELYNRMSSSHYEDAAAEALKKTKESYKKKIPALSIMMPCYNGEKYLKEAIDSILDQTYYDFELLVVDDASTDTSKEIIKEYEKKDKRVHYLKNEFKKGVSGALNTAIKNARGKFLARQDADDVSLKERLKMQINCLENNSNLGYCSVNINFLDKKSRVIKKNVYKRPTAPIEFEAAFVNPVPNGTLIYRKELIDKYKLEFVYQKTAEDYDFFLQYIYNSKLPGKFIENSLYNYRVLEGSLYHSNLEKSIEYSKKSAMDYYNKVTGTIIEKEKFNLVNLFDGYKFETDYNEIAKIYYDSIPKFQKYFNWNDEECFKVIEYIMEQKVIYYENTKPFKDTLKSKIKYQLDENGLFGTMKWALYYPFRVPKKILNKISKKGR